MREHPYLVVDIVSLEVAKIAKKIGYYIPTIAYFHPNYGLSANSFHEHDELENMNSDVWASGFYSAPTQSMLNYWLRKNHNIDVCVSPYHKSDGYSPSIYKDKLSCDILGGYGMYDKYEKAYNVGLLDACKIVDEGIRNDV